MIKLGEVVMFLGIFLALEAIGIMYAAVIAVLSGVLLLVYRKRLQWDPYGFVFRAGLESLVNGVRLGRRP